MDKVLELDSRFHRSPMRPRNPMLATITEYITRLTLPSRLEHTRKVLAKGRRDRAVRRGAPPAAQRRSGAGRWTRSPLQCRIIHLLEEVAYRPPACRKRRAGDREFTKMGCLR